MVRHHVPVRGHGAIVWSIRVICHGRRRLVGKSGVVCVVVRWCGVVQPGTNGEKRIQYPDMDGYGELILL